LQYNPTWPQFLRSTVAPALWLLPLTTELLLLLLLLLLPPA
jgi:hypothetical protein